MIRQTLTTGSTHAIMLLTPSQGTDFQYRATTNGSSASATTNGNGSSIAASYWVKLTRVGNTFTGYHPPDGSTWTQIGSASITMATSGYIGLAVTSHNDGTLSTANFDNISFITSDGFGAETHLIVIRLLLFQRLLRMWATCLSRRSPPTAA